MIFVMIVRILKQYKRIMIDDKFVFEL